MEGATHASDTFSPVSIVSHMVLVISLPVDRGKRSASHSITGSIFLVVARVFETQACMSCHTIRGTAATGRFGPDLTHLMSRQTLASGAADNNVQTLKQWIQNPASFKSACLMPAM